MLVLTNALFHQQPSKLIRSAATKHLSPPVVRFLATMSPVSLHCGMSCEKFPCTMVNLTLAVIVHVFIKVKPGTEDAFKAASLENARNSAKESGVARFDVLQDKADPCQFVLVEVYKDQDTAPAAHKQTQHYLQWRETVADMMAEPRTARSFDNLFPTTSVGWEYPSEESLEA